jgi:hypothetical protein
MAVEQLDLNVLVPLRRGLTDEARRTLIDMGRNLANHPTLRLRNSRSTHFARFVIIEGDPDRLLFTSNYDGLEESYLSELVEACGAGLDQIFRHCEGYEPGAALQSASFKRFVRGFRHKSNLFFVSLPGLSAKGIRNAGETRAIIERMINSVGPAAIGRLRELADASPERLRQRQSGFEKTPPWLAKILNWLARTDKTGPNPNTIVRPSDIASHEDLHVQNSLTVVGQVKKSIIRRLILRGYLFLGRGAFALRPPWGSLAGVTSIHFARWLIVDGGDTLIFESNYDGSWDSYIDNFVDVTSAGLNLIWSSCEGYPRAGCEDVDSFKNVIRGHQKRDLIFYSAYPDLTVKNIIANHAVDLAVQSFVRTADVDFIFAGSNEIND